MKTEAEIRERLNTLNQYYLAGWIPEESMFTYAENELLWVLGEVDD